LDLTPLFFTKIDVIIFNLVDLTFLTKPFFLYVCWGSEEREPILVFLVIFAPRPLASEDIGAKFILFNLFERLQGEINNDATISHWQRPRGATAVVGLYLLAQV